MKNQNTTVALIGGSGKIGTELLKRLVDDGFHIKLLLRNPESFKFKCNQITIVEGDARDIAVIRNLVEKSHVLVNTIGQPEKEEPLFGKVAENIVKTLPSYGIKRYISISGLGLETPFDRKRFLTRLIIGIMRLAVPKIMNDKKLEYKLISGSNLDWTIIRIPKVVLSTSRKAIKINEFDCIGMSIASADLISFIVNQLSDTSFFRKSPFIYN